MLSLACAEHRRSIETFGIVNLIGLRQAQSGIRKSFCKISLLNHIP